MKNAKVLMSIFLQRKKVSPTGKIHQLQSPFWHDFAAQIRYCVECAMNERYNNDSLSVWKRDYISVFVMKVRSWADIDCTVYFVPFSLIYTFLALNTTCHQHYKFFCLV